MRISTVSGCNLHMRIGFSLPRTSLGFDALLACITSELASRQFPSYLRLAIFRFSRHISWRVTWLRVALITSLSISTLCFAGYFESRRLQVHPHYTATKLWARTARQRLRLTPTLPIGGIPKYGYLTGWSIRSARAHCIWYIRFKLYRYAEAPGYALNPPTNRQRIKEINSNSNCTSLHN